jgi:trehalose 6-phosphate phosphatase
VKGAAAALLEGVPAALWSRAAAVPHRLLLLDYDGTLAPFRVRRDEARPLPGIARLVGRIAARGGTTVAVISGRPLAQLIGLVGLLPVVLVGEHGWESRLPDGRIERHALPDAIAARLEQAAGEAVAADLGGRVETKRGALVLHTRGLAATQAEEVVREGRRVWEPAAGYGGLRLDVIDGGLELRARSRDKGTAVRDLVAAAPAGALVVYLGDDVTDEDAFREAGRGGGFGIRVGTEDRRSLASGRLPSVEAVETFLERWLEIVPAPAGP